MEARPASSSAAAGHLNSASNAANRRWHATPDAQPALSLCLARRHRRARQFRRISHGPPGGGRPRRRARRAEGRPVMVATFDPHPVRHFKPDAAAVPADHARPARSACSPPPAPTRCWSSISTATLAAVTAPDFVADLLGRADRRRRRRHRRGFHLRQGPRRQCRGAARLLGAANGIAADAVAPVSDGGEPVSSSRIREALKAGDRATAARLLTRPFAIEGVVEHGDKRGRKLGYPTANIALGPYQRPRFGVYAVRVRLDDGSEHDGRRQSRHPADVRSAEGIARSPCSSTSTAISTARPSRSR